MRTISWTSWGIGLSTVLTLFISFFIFYSDTKELISSFSAAVLSALLLLISVIVIRWLIRVFT